MAQKFSQRTAAHSSAQLLWDTILGHSFGTQFWDTILGHNFGTQFWDTILGHNFGTDGFVTRSVREMIDFLMSILSTPFCVHADKTSNFVDLLLTLYPVSLSIRVCQVEMLKSLKESRPTAFLQRATGAGHDAALPACYHRKHGPGDHRL